MSRLQDRITAPSLMYAGTIPFVASALLFLALPATSGWIAPVREVLTAYALVIASFMAGVHWGQQLGLAPGWQRALMLLSNAVALAVWLGFLLLPFTPMLLLLVAAFALLAAIDHRLADAGLLSRRYFFHRKAVTAIVCAALIVSGLAA
ncbi:DUF3429 domain-containing protein [Rhodobacteraceae bacterium 63075]|nr:DUF3429 domain-containing protein [Rhodobacteraceae bacterium 63075]